MLEQRLQQQFFECADLQYQVAEAQVRPLAAAVQALLGCITAGGKLLVAEAGVDAPLAPYFVSLFVRGFERDRPPLAAALAMNGAAQALHIQALGNPDDLLLLLDAGADDEAARAAIKSAHGADMAVVALAGATPAWARELTETDVLISVPSGRRARVRELHLLMLHALADSLDLQLMGEQESA